MVLVGISDLDEETSAKYPGIHQYGQCQSRAFMKGIFAFFAGGAAGLTTSYIIRHRYWHFPAAYDVVFVAGGAIVTSYIVASIASKQCQKLWVHAARRQNAEVTKDPRAITETAVREASAHFEDDGLKMTKYGDKMGLIDPVCSKTTANCSKL